jgi:hypothetical protein
LGDSTLLAEPSDTLSFAAVHRKSTQTEAKLKLITQQTKSIGKFDFNVYNENTKQIQTELHRHSKIYSCLQKNITDLKLNSLQTYASKVNP